MSDIFAEVEPAPQPPIKKRIVLRIGHPDIEQLEQGGEIDMREAKVELLINGEPFDLTLCQEISFRLRADDMMPVVTLSFVATDVEAFLPYGEVRKDFFPSRPGRTETVGGTVLALPLPAPSSPAVPPGGSIIDPGLGVDQLRLAALLGEYNQRIGRNDPGVPADLPEVVPEPINNDPPLTPEPVMAEPIKGPPILIEPLPSEPMPAPVPEPSMPMEAPAPVDYGSCDSGGSSYDSVSSGGSYE